MAARAGAGGARSSFLSWRPRRASMRRAASRRALAIQRAGARARFFRWARGDDALPSGTLPPRGGVLRLLGVKVDRQHAQTLGFTTGFLTDAKSSAYLVSSRRTWLAARRVHLARRRHHRRTAFDERWRQFIRDGETCHVTAGVDALRCFGGGRYTSGSQPRAGRPGVNETANRASPMPMLAGRARVVKNTTPNRSNCTDAGRARDHLDDLSG